MTILSFIPRSALRDRRQIALAVASLGASLLLLLVLHTVFEQLADPPLDAFRERRLVVRPATSTQDQLPIAHVERVRSIPGVVAAIPVHFGRAHPRADLDRIVTVLAVDADGFWEMFPEVDVSDATREAFLASPDAMLVGPNQLRKQGWRVGQTVTLDMVGRHMSEDLETRIVGTYRRPDRDDILYVRYDYMNRVNGEPDDVVAVWALADSAASVPSISEAIDARFDNDSARTRTESERAFLASFMSMFGDVRAILHSLSGAILWTMAIVNTGTMAIAIRKRTREVGVLKAIGFPSRLVFAMIVAESAMLGLLSAALALCGAGFFTLLDLRGMTGGFLPDFPLTAGTVAWTASIGLTIGALSGAYPAIRAARMTITGAVRSLD